MNRLVSLLLILLLVEVYSYQMIKTICRPKWGLGLYVVFSVIVVVYIIGVFYNYDRSQGPSQRDLWAASLFLLVYLPKMIVTLFMLSEDVFRVFLGVFNWVTSSASDSFLISRNLKFSWLTFSVAAIPFVALLHGMTIGKYNYQVVQHELKFKDLPKGFNGLKIVHLSDLHLGSLTDKTKVLEAINTINELEPDLILFTGDIVNSKASEIEPWITVFNQLKEPVLGMYSVLGNHDYGDYVLWDSNEDKKKNFEKLIELQATMRLQLLNNENVALKRNGESIRLIGTENWGSKFKKMGDLKKASEGVEASEFKIVMTHDPSHWNSVIKKSSEMYHLTLSGHTHGMQFGIEIPKVFKWSPSKYIYDQWAGIYTENSRYINVNRGFGFHAYSGRVGIWPEITLITLKNE